MMMTRDKITSRGFSLIELLVSIAIVGLVMTLGTKAFYSLTSAWAEARTLAELDDTAEDAFYMIGLDMSDLLSAELSGVSIRGIDQVAEADRFNQAGNNDDRLIIPIQGLTVGMDMQRVRSVQFQVLRGDDSNELVRRVGLLGAANPGKNESKIITRANVLRFDVTYATGDVENPWVTSWDAVSLPKAVRVSLTLADTNNIFRQISRKETYLVHVQ